MGSPEDAELVREARSGSREAFAELVRRHHVAVLRLCLSLLGGRPAAEDAAQEVFLKAWKSLEGFAGASAFSTWLHRIASNHCLDLLRKEARLKTRSLDELVEREGDRVQRLLAAPADSAAALEAADLAARLLALLPEDYRLILVLRELQGLSYSEISAAMDCSLDSVKARLRRARAALQEILRHFPGAGNV